MTSNGVDESNDWGHVEYQYDADTPPSIAIVEAIAAIEDIDPTDLHTDRGMRLSDQIDPEKLNRLVADSGGAVTVTFDLTISNGQQYVVQIHDGKIIIQIAD